MSADGLTPELIETAAKLCGWERRNPGSWFVVQWNNKNRVMAALDQHPLLFPDGLLALEDALLRRGWKLDWYRLDGYWWLSPNTKRSWYHDDRATAACLAAQAELEGK